MRRLQQEVAEIGHNQVIILQKMSEMFAYMQRQSADQLSSAPVPRTDAALPYSPKNNTPSILTHTGLLPTTFGSHRESVST